ncbi:hypothetical protein CARUB_v10007454mg, partial [Capsella rubella]
MATDEISNHKGEGDSEVLQSTFAATKFEDNVIYKLYFKGLVSNETVGNSEMVYKVGIGFAICDEADNLLYGINESFNSALIYREEVEMMALITGLNDAFHSGVRNLIICCDDYQTSRILLGSYREKLPEKLVHLLDQVQRLRARIANTKILVLASNDVKFAFNLARDAMVSQGSSTSDGVKAAPPQREVCTVCFEETDPELMFFNEECFHRHCFSCVKQYVEVKLSMGALPTCLEYGCKSELNLENCSMVLTPKLIEMWKQKIEDDLIPAADKIYCPYPTCSVLMSKTEISSEAGQSNVRSCIKCYGLFCIDCKVPWHSDLSCDEFKKLHPELLIDEMKLLSLANDNMWRQCDRCKLLIERDHGCCHMTCKCKYEFCYKCGIKWMENQQE